MTEEARIGYLLYSDVHSMSCQGRPTLRVAPLLPWVAGFGGQGSRRAEKRAGTTELISVFHIDLKFHVPGLSHTSVKRQIQYPLTWPSSKSRVPTATLNLVSCCAHHSTTYELHDSARLVTAALSASENGRSTASHTKAYAAGLHFFLTFPLSLSDTIPFS